MGNIDESVEKMQLLLDLDRYFDSQMNELWNMSLEELKETVVTIEIYYKNSPYKGKK